MSMSSRRLDINIEPEKSYIKEFKDKLERAMTKHKTRLGILPTSSSQNNHPQSGQDRELPPAASRVDYIPGKYDLGDKMTSVSKHGQAPAGPPEAPHCSTS